MSATTEPPSRSGGAPVVEASTASRRPGLRMPPVLRGARAAFVFLTRIPVGGFPYARADFHWAPAYFPLVGAVVGCMGAGVLLLALPLGALVAASLAVAATVFATGAFHEDGLADTADALGGSHGPKRALDILKDSRIGAFGAVTLVLSQVLRVGLLAELATDGIGRAAVALVLAHTLGRTGPLWLMATLPYVTGPDAKGATVAEGDKRAPVLMGTVLAALAVVATVSVGLTVRDVCAAVVATALCALALGRWYRRRLGGLAGDLLGAQEQGTEVAVLLGVLWVGRVGVG